MLEMRNKSEIEKHVEHLIPQELHMFTVMQVLLVHHRMQMIVMKRFVMETNVLEIVCLRDYNVLMEQRLQDISERESFD